MAIHHKPDYSIDRSNPEEILYFYAVAWLRDSPVPIFHVMNRMEVDRIRASSAMKNGVPWTQWYDRMGLKSAIKYLSDKRLPVTEIPGMADLVEIDNRAEAGKVTRPLEGESDEALGEKIDEETKSRAEELKMKLREAEEAARKQKELIRERKGALLRAHAFGGGQDAAEPGLFDLQVAHDSTLEGKTSQRYRVAGHPGLKGRRVEEEFITCINSVHIVQSYW